MKLSAALIACTIYATSFSFTAFAEDKPADAAAKPSDGALVTPAPTGTDKASTKKEGKVTGDKKAVAAKSKDDKNKATRVEIKTNMGRIVIELDEKKAPISTKNFLRYVSEKHYSGTIFHRVIKGFMIQGGGMGADMVEKKAHEPIKNEAGNGLLNTRGTVAMARTNVVNSAAAQFFINVVDNAFLNHASEEDARFGYAVFGKVVEGMDVVDKIRETPTANKNGMADVPIAPVVIESAKKL